MAENVEPAYADVGNEPKGKKKKLTIDEKRLIIEHNLENRFPKETFIYFITSYFEIGIVGIALQIALMAYQAPLNRFGNGIWGGLFALGNCIIKYYAYKKRDYQSLVIFQTLTVFAALGAGAGLVILSGVCLGQYPCQDEPNVRDCSPRNFAITLAMHLLGYVALFKNIISVIVINYQLFGGRKQMFAHRLGFVEGYRELYKILTGKL